MCVDDVLDMRIAQGTFEFRCDLTHMYWLVWLVFGPGLSLSIAIISRTPDPGNALFLSLVAVSTSVLWTTLACGDFNEKVIAHARAAVCTPQRVVEPPVLWVLCDRRWICQVRNRSSKRGWCYELARRINYRLSNKKFTPVDVKLGSGTADVGRYCLAVIVDCLIDSYFSC